MLSLKLQTTRSRELRAARPKQLATVFSVVNAFIGAEALLLLGFDRHQMPIRASLRRVGELIRAAEERSAAGDSRHSGDGARREGP